MSSDSFEKFEVALGQMTSVDNWAENEKQILDLMDSLSDLKEIDLFCFPENALFMRLSEGAVLESVTLRDRVFDGIHKRAQDVGVTVHLGSVPLKQEGKVYNSAVLLRPDGSREAPYRKMHLFDVDIAGHRSYRESDSAAHGERPAVFDVNGWRFGSTICYDLRFSELFHWYAVQEVDAIVVPSAFTVPTGKAHWDVLLRARAIESQCYVLAAAQAGSHRGRRETYGHSLIVSPWGETLAEGRGDRPEVLRGTLTRDAITKVRSQIPMKNHRRRW